MVIGLSSFKSASRDNPYSFYTNEYIKITYYHIKIAKYHKDIRLFTYYQDHILCRPFRFIDTKTLIYLAFQSFDF